MGNPAQMQTQGTPPVVLHLGAMKAKYRTGKDGDLPLRPASSGETSGVTPQVSPKATSGKPSPKDCTTEQLFEIVIDVARKFRTAKEVVAEHKDYILRLKTDVFKVRFGSAGVRVLVTWKTEDGLPAGTAMYWQEFCESQFGVSADWINRICGGKTEDSGQEARGSSIPDWKTALITLINALEQCGDSLPLLAQEALHAAQEVLKDTQTSDDFGAMTPGQDVAALSQISGNRMSSQLVIARANARDIPLASNSVQCVVTSPPYWGLRKYAGSQELVWGGAERCGHEWSPNGTRKQSPQRDHAPDGSFGATRGVEKSRAGTAYEASLGNTCLRCGAWRGAFGLEPDVEMYVQHTVEILREVRRVLRPDGVCFWTLADSYSGSGKGGGSNGKACTGEKQQTVRGSSGLQVQEWGNLKPKDMCLIPQRIALAAQQDGWWIRDSIIWHKPNPYPASVEDRCTNSYETILMLTKSEKYCWNQYAVMELTTDHQGTRNPRNVWTFPVGSYEDQHFAAFPDELPLRCIRAACPEKGCCRFCGTPWKRVTKVGWTPGCKCGRQRGITKPCLVLDPFGGAGTTGLAARKLQQDCVLFDISAEYVQMMRERLEGTKHDEAGAAQIEIDSGDPRRYPWPPLVAQIAV